MKRGQPSNRAKAKKKLRFAPEVGQELDAGVDESTVLERSWKREQKVDNVGSSESSGAESDEDSDDNTSVRYKSKKRRGEEDDHDDDMFAASGPSPTRSKSVPKNGRPPSVVSELALDMEDTQVDDAQITPFNLDQELQEGNFNDAGQYVETKDEFAHHDGWLQGISAEAIEDARKAHERRAATLNPTNLSRIERDHMMEQMLQYMEPEETVLNSLARLGRLKRKSDVEALTGLAANLLGDGDVLDIYEFTFERIRATVLRSKNEAGDEAWEYKWQGRSDIYGPFSSAQLKHWNAQGFFQSGVLVRQVGSTQFREISHVTELVAQQYL